MPDPYIWWKAYGYYKAARDLKTEWRRIRGVTWRRGNRLTVDWLRGELRGLGFDSQDELSEGYLAECLFNLNVNGMFWEGQVLEFLGDEVTLRDLKVMYEPPGSQLERELKGSRLDAHGYTAWGPMLHRAHPEVREDMRHTIAECLRRSRERQALNKEKGW